MILSVVLALFPLAGCSNVTRYRPFVKGQVRDGGFSNTRYSADTYSVTYQGTQFSKTEQIYDFALLRSAELTEACGFKFFTVQAASEGSRELAQFVPSGRGEPRSWKDGVITHHNEAPTSHTPAQVIKIKIPIHTLTVKMHGSREGVSAPSGDIYEAASLVARLKAKYHIK